MERKKNHRLTSLCCEIKVCVCDKGTLEYEMTKRHPNNNNNNNTMQM